LGESLFVVVPVVVFVIGALVAGVLVRYRRWIAGLVLVVASSSACTTLILISMGMSGYDGIAPAVIGVCFGILAAGGVVGMIIGWAVGRDSRAQG
jgi:hypothetical protein